MEDVQSHTVLAQALFQGIYALPDAYNNALQNEDMDKCINFGRIFTELAESLLEVIVNTPTQGKLRMLSDGGNFPTVNTYAF